MASLSSFKMSRLVLFFLPIAASSNYGVSLTIAPFLSVSVGESSFQAYKFLSNDWSVISSVDPIWMLSICGRLFLVFLDRGSFKCYRLAKILVSVFVGWGFKLADAKILDRSILSTIWIFLPSSADISVNIIWCLWAKSYATSRSTVRGKSHLLPKSI